MVRLDWSSGPVPLTLSARRSRSSETRTDPLNLHFALYCLVLKGLVAYGVVRLRWVLQLRFIAQRYVALGVDHEMKGMEYSMLYETQHRVVQAAVQVGHMMSRTTSQHGLCFAAIGSFLAWTDSYFILHVLNRRRSAEWNCRLVTVVHAVISTALCLTSALIIGPWPFSHVGEPNTRLHTTIMVVSLGYFFFDFLWSLYMQTESNIMLAHHLVSILGFMYCLYTGRAGCELTAVMGASELTNPLLQLRWFLKETGLYRGRLAKIIDSVFVFLFLFCRLGVGTLFHYVCQTSPKLDLVSKGGGQAFYIISFIFGVQLVLFYYKRHIKKKL